MANNILSLCTTIVFYHHKEARTKRAIIKKPAQGGLFYNGGEGGIRTLGTVRYTHFPGVLFRPLRHLSKFGAGTLHKVCLKRNLRLFISAILAQATPLIIRYLQPS
jgi:hypothetical protein